MYPAGLLYNMIEDPCNLLVAGGLGLYPIGSGIEFEISVTSIFPTLLEPPRPVPMIFNVLELGEFNSE